MFKSKLKKGFTLIELLAIIVILAVIAVITVPIILNIIDNSKKGAAIDSAYGYIKAVNEFNLNEMNKDINFTGLNGDNFIIDNGNLIDDDNTYNISISGEIPKSGRLSINSNGYISGCMVINDYRIIIDNNQVSGDVIKDNCGYTYVLKFETNGGELIEPITSKEGEKINLPTNVLKVVDDITFTFEKWVDSKGNDVSNIMPSHNETYYAKYKDLGAKFKNRFITTVLDGKDKKLVKAVKQTDNITSEQKERAFNVSSTNIPIYMWYDTIDDINTIYWYSTDSTPGFANSSLATLFMDFSNLSDISGLSNWDLSGITNTSYMFQSSGIQDVNSLTNWDTSNVITMGFMFNTADKLDDISGLVNWNVSNVESMQRMFSSTKIKNVNSLINWDVSKVSDMNNLFSYINDLSDIKGLINWDVSNVTNMGCMFCNSNNLTDISGLANWNVSKVINMSFMFYSGTRSQLNNISYLSNWDTSNVTNMAGMFERTSINKLDSLSNWDVSKVTNMADMFRWTPNIESLKPLEKWNPTNVTNISQMFRGLNKVPDASMLKWTIKGDTNYNAMFYEASIVNTGKKYPTFYIDEEKTILNDGQWNNSTFTPGKWNEERTEFTSGKWNQDGTFTPGTWSNGIFTPSE